MMLGYQVSFSLFMNCFLYSTNFVTGFNSLTTTRLLTNAPTQMGTMTTREGENNRGTLTRTMSNSRTTEQRQEMLGDEGGDEETQTKKAQDNGGCQRQQH
jgi:hypothetical protein